MRTRSTRQRPDGPPGSVFAREPEEQTLVVDRSLGMKRTCPECSARFYDLNRDPIECPKCGAKFTVEPILPSREDQQQAMEEAAAPEPAEETADDDITLDDAAEDVDDAAAVKDTLGDVPDVEVGDDSADDAAFLEPEADTPVEEIVPAAIEKDDEE